ncbi:MAG: NAD(P)H-dependent oxidoreductase subunit E, partial [Planctomycetota bacterium]|nr:NAD(P)H-dependent oxidoreductase subunit E [Planctomycetota bacterium]
MANRIEFSPGVKKEWEGILTRYPVKRAALIPTLHLAQREFAVLTTEVEEYVAALMDLSVTDVHEVVTFYTLLPRRPRGKRHIRVCRDLPCHLLGSAEIIDRLEKRLGVPPGETTDDAQWSWEEVSCLGSCDVAPMMQVDETYVGPLEVDGLADLFDRIENGETPQALPRDCDVPEKIVSTNFGRKEACRLRTYRASGGYEMLGKILTGMTPVQVRDTVKAGNLRGLGGAGFPAAVKWGFIPKDTDKPVYLVVNADEGEPGTFKDRYILEWDPHRMIEGMAIAAYAIGAHHAYIYVRGEYRRPTQRLQAAIDEAEAAGFLGEKILGTGFDLKTVIHVGAGAYICGEETALLESLEGKKGWPRLKPPFPAVVGAFGSPTIVNNVETLAYVPEIFRRGPAAFDEIADGCERSGGMRILSLSGRVKRPGPYELPLGTSLRKLIFEHGGGISGGRKLKAVIPGGASAPVLTADEIDVGCDFDDLRKAGSMGGSGAVIVLDDSD